MKPEKEKYIEQRLVYLMQANKGWAIKFTSTNVRGVPDRMCIFPSGRIVFVELKRPGAKPSALQYKIHTKLRRLGQTVKVIDSKIRVEMFIQTAIKKGWFDHDE